MGEEDSESRRQGEPSARPRLKPTAELAERFAELLAQPHAHQLGVCAQLQLSYATYKRWMAKDLNDVDDDMEHVQFQAIVLQALERERVKDIQKLDKEFDGLDGARVAVAGPLVNKHTFHHQNRFKRFYANDDEPKRTEVDLGNKDGAAFKTSNRHGLTEATRRALITSVLGVSEDMLEAGNEAGKLDMDDESEL
jgi:hypothetical protein